MKLNGADKIVPAATFHLFRAIAGWPAIESITITSLSFPSDQLQDVPLLPLSQRLRTLYLGQATFLPPSAIAAMVLHQEPEEQDGGLEQIRLVDTYPESIWGKRLRRADIEKAALTLPFARLYGAEAAIERIRRIVRCEAMNERIMGGDRSEGLTVLE